MLTPHLGGRESSTWKVSCTPHLGYVERDSYELYFGEAFDQVIAFAADKPINVVNPEAL